METIETFTISIVVCCLLSAFQVVKQLVIPTSGQDMGPHNCVFGDTNEHSVCQGSGIVPYRQNRLDYPPCKIAFH
jgi:hypothetical protein